ncbi:hypothetical protein CPB86DRAFT_773358 [Serendipita vermifera]|nr:hypothetical protein CPB86DRAFT_773358 [Serendipita vermifera]
MSSNPNWTTPVISVQRSSVDVSQTSSRPSTSTPASSSIDPQWGANFWVTLADPQSGAEFYACPATGECSWEPPIGNFVLPPNDQGQWWELSDDSRGGVSYYYHTATGETRWDKPEDAFVIPLQVIQTTTLGRRLSVTAMNKRNSQNVNTASVPETVSEVTDELANGQSQPSPDPSSKPRRPGAEQASSQPTHPNGGKTGSTSSSDANGRHTPPSPTRQQQHRSSGTPYPASSYQQSLDAAAEMVVRPSRSASTSGPGGRVIETSRSAPNFRQSSSGMHGGFPSDLPDSRRRELLSNPKLRVITDSAPMGQNTSKSAVESRSPSDKLPSPRRVGPAVSEKLRPRRNTTTNQISNPMVVPDTHHLPLADTGGGPIMVNGSTQTKRLSTGDHRTLPKSLAQEIQKFQVADFAKRYFTTHRTGLLFRRRIPVEQLMVWQKAPLTSPLLVLNRSLHKDAVKIFKIIQRIMGDRQSDRPSGSLRMHSDGGYTSGRESGRESEHSHARSSGASILEEERWLLSEGLLHGELRDEIYCQLVKQLSGNPSAESIFRGWQLLCVLVVTFPPSKNFEDYLRSFMRERSNHTEGRIDVMSKYCLAKLRVIAKKGPRGKAPSLQEIEIAQDAAFNPSTFGESLSSVFQLQQRTYPGEKIPIILPFLADGILALGGMKAEGIFRVPGENDVVSDLRLRIDRGFYNLDNIDDPHVPASLLKLWLRELQDPLIPDELYNACISCSEDPDKVTEMATVLPTINRRVLLFVVSFLQMFLDERVMKVTKMTAVNLAVIFAPNILRCNSDSMTVVFTNARYEQAFVHNLLLHLNCSKSDPDFVPVHGLGPQ